MENQAADGAREVINCSNCGESERMVVGRFGATSPFSVATGYALGAIPVGHASYLEGVVCLSCGTVRLRLAEKDLAHLRAKLEN